MIQGSTVSIFTLAMSNFFTVWIPLAKKQRVVDCVKVLLDIAKESADWFPPLKSALGGVNALIMHYEVLLKSMPPPRAQLTQSITAIRRCQREGSGSYTTVR